ncbi:hypothetical protein L873DRAFT_1811951 [Choiromyces venosus 120613-1]|uniref:Uncharacterized protein n=1 Tax=Choiromyces venosus 120613-1 TaxID=1336337 RepID=A0A3N4JGI0_9PEZI|nr:hypothetical protein L873DRAFT_1811951 [Choiromyces venosus 120613-1]
MPSRKDLLRLEHLKSTYEGHRKAADGLKKATEGNREIIEEQKKKGLKRTNQEPQDLLDNFRVVVDTTMVPIVTAVVLKSFYKKGLRLVQMRDHVSDIRADIIRRHQDRFNEFCLAISEKCLIL